MPVNTGYLSDLTTVFSNFSVTGVTSITSTLASLSAVTTSLATIIEGRIPSGGTLSVAGRMFSTGTLAASALTASAANTNVRANQFGFTIGGASGASLFIHSGGTVYIFNSAISAAAT